MVASEPKSFIASVTPDGDLQIPEEARALLKREGVKQVAIIADAVGVHFVSLTKTLDEIQGSAKTDRVFSIDFDDEIEEAMEEALVQKYGRGGRKMTTSFLAKLSTGDEGESEAFQITIPGSVRSELGLDDVDAVAVVLDDGKLRVEPVPMPIEDVRSSIPYAPGVSIDLDDEVEEAIEIAIREKYG